MICRAPVGRHLIFGVGKSQNIMSVSEKQAELSVLRTAGAGTDSPVEREKIPCKGS
jgi:hypothetical protein